MSNNPSSTTYHLQSTTYSKAFTIVELLVVIVVIGILAAITIISYRGISIKANNASLQSDLTNFSNRLKMYQVDKGSFPTAMTNDGNGNYCPTPVDTRYCIKASSGNTLTYIPTYSASTPQTYSLSNTNGTTNYYITNDSPPIAGVETVTIGTQVWMKYNLDVGTMINGGTAQTNNGTIEKWCYNNNPANCSIHGGLYQWDEMMQYVITEGTQGIAPVGFHIPTDAEYTTLTTYLGGESVAGDKMKIAGICQGRTPCATSGFGGLFGGDGYNNSWNGLGSTAGYWSSSNSFSPYVWYRYLDLSMASVTRTYQVKDDGLSLRCIKN